MGENIDNMINDVLVNYQRFEAIPNPKSIVGFINAYFEYLKHTQQQGQIDKRVVEAASQAVDLLERLEQAYPQEVTWAQKSTAYIQQGAQFLVDTGTNQKDAEQVKNDYEQWSHNSQRKNAVAVLDSTTQYISTNTYETTMDKQVAGYALLFLTNSKEQDIKDRLLDPLQMSFHDIGLKKGVHTITVQQENTNPDISENVIGKNTENLINDVLDNYQRFEANPSPKSITEFINAYFEYLNHTQQQGQIDKRVVEAASQTFDLLKRLEQAYPQVATWAQKSTAYIQQGAQFLVDTGNNQKDAEQVKNDYEQWSHNPQRKNAVAVLDSTAQYIRANTYETTMDKQIAGYALLFVTNSMDKDIKDRLSDTLRMSVHDVGLKDGHTINAQNESNNTTLSSILSKLTNVEATIKGIRQELEAKLQKEQQTQK